MPSRIQLMMSPQPQDLEADLVAMHDRVCTIGKPICEADLRTIAARALRRAFLAEVFAAWQAGRLSEGQAAELLGHKADRVGLREVMEAVGDRAEEWWDQHRASREPLAVRSTGGD